MDNVRKIVLEENDIKELDQIINSLPTFAKNINENMIVSQSVNLLFKFLSSKIIQENDDL